jgi:dTDP-4-amino-4,6-dideoxy-D-galactose acyltransferase
MSEPCRILDWDTAFFGCRIARAAGPRVSAEAMPPVLEWCARERVRCLYLLAAADDAATVSAAENHGFHLVDIRVTLERHAAACGLPAGVLPAGPEDVPGLEEIAAASHTDSRFYFDHNFARERCAQLYATWIRQSCAGDAQAVLVKRREDRPAGYVTCHWDGPSGRIGLLGVAGWARGSGAGRELVEAALATFAAHGATGVSVATQGRNLASQRLYQRCGFVTRSVELWYHRWFA